MHAFDRIVVGLDGTDFGFEALRQTLTLGPPDGVVYAVTALDTSIAVHAGFNMSNVATQLEEEADRARATATEIMDDQPDHTTKLVRGDARSVLRHACAEYDATLLALGGRSSSRFLGMMTGETASTLLHEAALSVLLARPQWGKQWQPNRIVVGLDGSEFSLAALSVADDLADRFGAAIQVVTATGGKPVERGGAWAERVTDWDPGHPVAALRDRSTLADLLILGSRGLHGVKALGSISERVAQSAHCLALVIHPQPPSSLSG